jgi:hypothetical protein
MVHLTFQIDENRRKAAANTGFASGGVTCKLEVL